MSKSLGNVIAPSEMVEKYGVDGTRYLLLSMGQFGEDKDITWQWLTEKYNADLANGLGNLVSRVIALADACSAFPQKGEINIDESIDIAQEVNSFGLSLALEKVWERINGANKYIEEHKPWELRKNDVARYEKVMEHLLGELNVIAKVLKPFLPETSMKITKMLQGKEKEILFQRIAP